MWRVVALIAVPLLLAAGCGGGDLSIAASEAAARFQSFLQSEYAGSADGVQVACAEGDAAEASRPGAQVLRFQLQRPRRRLCRASNLSASGVFVETGNLGLRRGQTVELAFAISLGTVTKIHRRTAVVAHISRGGTGLMMEGQGG